MALWEWDVSPEVKNSKCETCKEPMRLARNSAVRYQGKVYHEYCLLTLLAEYHSKQTGSYINTFGSDVISDFPWGGP